VVLLGDTSDPSGIAAAAADCDLLVCEATYDGSRAEKARIWGHMTAPGAGAFAAAIRARALAITHFSSRYGDGHSPITCADLVAEAAAACPGVPVWPAGDLQCLAMHPDGRVEPALRPGGSTTIAPL
jgi:ribonuclease Z